MGEMTLVAATEVAPAELQAAFTAAFSDYLIGPFEVPLARWPHFLARQAVDLGLSRVARLDRRILSFALVAPRAAENRWRLATMGAPPSARGSGAAPVLLDDFLQRAAAAGQQAVELEVFAQNERAFRLYRSRGFAPRHALHAHSRLAPAGEATEPPPSIRVVDAASAFAWLAATARSVRELPLQVTPAVLAVLPTLPSAWQLGGAQLVFGPNPDGSVAIHSLIDRHPAQTDAEALVAALLARHPGQMVKVPALQRSDLGGEALLRAGFTSQVLHQWWMWRAVMPSTP